MNPFVSRKWVIFIRANVAFLFIHVAPSSQFICLVIVSKYKKKCFLWLFNKILLCIFFIHIVPKRVAHLLIFSSNTFWMFEYWKICWEKMWRRKIIWIFSSRAMQILLEQLKLLRTHCIANSDSFWWSGSVVGFIYIPDYIYWIITSSWNFNTHEYL